MVCSLPRIRIFGAKPVRRPPRRSPVDRQPDLVHHAGGRYTGPVPHGMRTPSLEGAAPPGATSFASRRRQPSDNGPGRALRILKIAPTPFFADYGCHVRIFEEIRLLQSLGHQVRVVTYPAGRDLDDVDIRRIPNVTFASAVKVGSSRRKLLYDPILAAEAMRQALGFRPDIVHAHLHEGALVGYVLKQALGLPVLFDYQGSLTSEMVDHQFITRESLWYGPLRRIERWIAQRADCILTSSQNAADGLRAEFGWEAPRVIPLTDRVDTDRFVPRWTWSTTKLADLKCRLGVPPDRKVVVYLGLLAEYQGIGLLLQAASQLALEGRPVHFLIMGFPGDETYRTVAAQMGIGDYVTFTGKVEYEEAPIHLALGDIAVSAKLSETEGNGKLLNYMACGIPTVTFDTPVAREILGDLGVYARLGDPFSLAAAMRFILDDEPAAGALGSRLRQNAEQAYSWHAAVPLLQSVLYRLAERRRPAFR